MSSAANDEDKYTLDYFPNGGCNSGGDEPPFMYRTFYLDDALAEAWRIAREGGSALRIRRRKESALDETALKELLNKMSMLEGEQSGRGARELAALAINGPGEAEAGAGETEPDSGGAGTEEIESPS